MKRSTAATDDQIETILRDYIKGDPNIHLELSGLARDRKAPTVQDIQALRGFTEVGVERQKPRSLQKRIADLELHKFEIFEKSVSFGVKAIKHLHIQTATYDNAMYWP